MAEPKNTIVSEHMRDLIKKLERTEKRQAEALEDTRKQLAAIRELVAK